MADDDKQPIIIKKIYKKHGGHHGGAWKVAFADFMTAMMAFFMVMWLVGQKPEVRESVAGYFRDPGNYKIQGGSGVLRGSSSVIPGINASTGMKVMVPQHSGGGPTDAERKHLESSAQKIMNQLRQQEAFRRLKDNIKFDLTAEGLRIILNESENSPAFFEPGSAKPLAKSASILITIARELGQLSNDLVIEGHTDANFTGGQDYGNWELSADRANAARQLMEVSGLAKGQVREVRGFADQSPMIKNNPSDARNRRVTIVVLYKSVSMRYDDLEIGAELMHEMGE